MRMSETQTQANPANRWRPVVAVLPVFVLTRLVIFLAVTSATDSQVYYQYGVAARVSSVGDLYRSYDAEYPQLAVVFAAGVGVVADALPPGAERVIGFRRSLPPDVGTARFQVALGLVLGAIDIGVLLLIAGFARKANPGDERTQTWRLWLYVAGTAALGPILYDRLDLVVGALAFFAVLAVSFGRSLLAYVLLTAGVGFKLVPAVLLPVFVLSAAARSEKFWPAFLREVIRATVVFAAWPVLAYCFGGGDRAFAYVKYHAARGPELGSVYAAPLLLSPDASVGYEFGGYAVLGPTADTVAKVSPFLSLAFVGIAILVAGYAIRKCPRAEQSSLLAAGCVLVWFAFILTNKVGSPQYLLWIAPLVPLLPLRTKADRAWVIGTVIAGVLATLTYPYLWPQVHGAKVSDQPETWAGPTPFGFALLFARWAVIAVLTVWLTARLLARRAPESDA
jgi:hypothetical protein